MLDFCVSERTDHFDQLRFSFFTSWINDISSSDEKGTLHIMKICLYIYMYAQQDTKYMGFNNMGLNI